MQIPNHGGDVHTGGRRVMEFWTADIERRILVALAGRLPATIRPNHMTGLGVLGAVGAGAAYAASSVHPAWLFLANLALALNWVGDSLDGTLARVRHIERPRFGYYLDHVVDAFNTVAVGIGLGLSPFIQIELALGLVILYLALSINVYVESAVFDEFRMAYGRIGPTEARLLLVIGNTVLIGTSRMLDPMSLAEVTNALAGVVAIAGSVLLASRFASNLRRLSRLEPSRTGL